jgi:hypothetical protein
VETPLISYTSYPPNRVTDLKVVAMQVNQTSMTIEWTAPGQELDVGIGNISLLPVIILAIIFVLLNFAMV